MDSHRSESPKIAHSTVVKDIYKNGPRRSISSGGRFVLDTSKRIYDRGPRDLRAQIADSENTADFRFPAIQAFFVGFVKSWFELAVKTTETMRDTSVSYMSVLTESAAESKKETKK